MRGKRSVLTSYLTIREKKVLKHIHAYAHPRQWEASSESSDGVEDPFPRELGPLPSPSPERELTLCPQSGRRLARAEGEPTPPPTPPPATPPATPPPDTAHAAMLMKVRPYEATLKNC